MVGAIMNPFVDPTAAVVELSCHLGGWDSATVEFHRRTAEFGLFVI
jgi:hypothetical protein